MSNGSTFYLAGCPLNETYPSNDSFVSPILWAIPLLHSSLSTDNYCSDCQFSFKKIVALASSIFTAFTEMKFKMFIRQIDKLRQPRIIDISH